MSKSICKDCKHKGYCDEMVRHFQKIMEDYPIWMKKSY